jgi:RNA polymerase sigma-70 factor (ECF subfamily)
MMNTLAKAPSMPDGDFAAFLARVRAGDEAAAMELFRRFEPAIRREVRVRMTGPALARVMDDEDICQSVLASFFVRAALGQYDLRDPAQLRMLLLGMTRNKLAHAARRQGARKRGGHVAPVAVEELPLPGEEASPSRVASGRELLEQVRGQLGHDDRRVAELRGQGHDWAEIARRLGGTPNGRRMQLTRALNQVSQELGLPWDEE